MYNYYAYTHSNGIKFTEIYTKRNTTVLSFLIVLVFNKIDHESKIMLCYSTQ